MSPELETIVAVDWGQVYPAPFPLCYNQHMEWANAWAAAELIRLLYRAGQIDHDTCDRAINQLQVKVLELDIARSHKRRQRKQPDP